METRLLHSDVYLNDLIREKTMKVINNIKYFHLSKHMKDRILEADRSHRIYKDKLYSILNNISKAEKELFEVEITKENKNVYISKYVIRTKYNNDEDIAIALRPHKDFATGKVDITKALVVTAWLNNSFDSHTTLNGIKYLTKEEYEEFIKV